MGYVFWTDEDTYYDLTGDIEVEELLTNGRVYH